MADVEKGSAGNDLGRAFGNAWAFYRARMNLVFVFSIPFIAALLLLQLVAAPTFTALGAAYLRTGSIPELSYFDMGLAVLAYLVSFYIIAASIVNVNLVVLSRRTLTQISGEVVKAMGTYSLTIFYVYTIMLLLFFVANLLTYDSAFRTWLYPLAVLALSFLLFFVPPAVVIDHEDSAGAITRSIGLALRKPHYIAAWTVLGFALLAALKIIADIIPGGFSGGIVLMANCLFLLPYLIILQTQMYMEKYPLAR